VEVHFNKGLSGAPAEAVTAARDTSNEPGGIGRLRLAIIAGGRSASYPGIAGHEPDLEVAGKNASKIDKSMDKLRKVVPDAGSCLSQSNFFEQSWQQSYWGANYPRLRAVRRDTTPRVSSSSIMA
jgi:hypothetical protein